MNKINITLRCPDYPAVEKVFDGEKIYVVELENPYDAEDVLNKVEPIIIALRGNSQKPILLTAVLEGGSTLLRGTITKGFSGVRMI